VRTLFDRYIAIDWSASNQPKVGKDSIWSCVGGDQQERLGTVNHRTRRAAEAWLLEQLIVAVERGLRVLVGLDFPYGYPSGFAAALDLEGDPWRAVWGYLEREINDDRLNVSNRFEVAAGINARLGRHAPFWGRPEHLVLPSLPFRKEVGYHAPEPGGLSEWRQAEHRLHQLRSWPQSVWKLAGAGAVGSQTLVGVPVVARLRDAEALRRVSRVWPFEVRIPDLPPGAPAVIHAEIWPTIVPFDDEPGSCRDEQQVRAVVREWQRQDQAGALGALFAAAPDNDAVLRKEGWVLGVPAPGAGLSLRSRPQHRPSHTQPVATPTAGVAMRPAPSQSRPPCLCGCGNVPRGRHSRFMPGHDQRINPATGRRFNDHDAPPDTDHRTRSTLAVAPTQDSPSLYGTMQVWALRNPDGTFRGKFHRHDSYDCAGRRMYEENYAEKDDYVLVDLAELPGRHGACQFECCFKGQADAAAVADRYLGRGAEQRTPRTIAVPPPRGIRVGAEVPFRDSGTGETKSRTIVSGQRADPARGEVSTQSPIGRALLGREVGEIVQIELPRGTLQVEVVAVRPQT
jgi:hypothetical protein